MTGSTVLIGSGNLILRDRKQRVIGVERTSPDDWRVAFCHHGVAAVASRDFTITVARKGRGPFTLHLDGIPLSITQTPELLRAGDTVGIASIRLECAP